MNAQPLDAGTQIVTHHSVPGIDPRSVTAATVGGPRRTWRADSVVLVTQRMPRDDLYRKVSAATGRLAAEGIEALYRIGDCVTPRLIADSVFDGHRLAGRSTPGSRAVASYRREFHRVTDSDRRALGLPTSV